MRKVGSINGGCQNDVVARLDRSATNRVGFDGEKLDLGEN